MKIAEITLSCPAEGVVFFWRMYECFPFFLFSCLLNITFR